MVKLPSKGLTPAAQAKLDEARRKKAEQEREIAWKLQCERKKREAEEARREELRKAEAAREEKARQAKKSRDMHNLSGYFSGIKFVFTSPKGYFVEAFGKIQTLKSEIVERGVSCGLLVAVQGKGYHVQKREAQAE